MFYTFMQNNSGGQFDGYEYVIIESDNAEEANLLAKEYNIYFGGVDSGLDCSCCGDRWYQAREKRATEEPRIYGVPIADCTSSSADWMGLGPAILGPFSTWKSKVLVVFKDGRREVFW